jgi:hypothetical protein
MTSTNGGFIAYGQFNVETCVFCPELNLPFSPFFVGGATYDIQPLSNSNVLLAVNDKIYIFDPPSATPIQTLTMPPNVLITSVVQIPDGTIYISALANNSTGQLYTYNPTNNTVTLAGSFPPGTTLMDELFYWNNTLYVFGVDLTLPPPNFAAIFELTLGNPLIATPVWYVNTTCSTSTATIQTGPSAGIYTVAFEQNCSSTELSSYDLSDNTTSVQCSNFPLSLANYGMGSIPSGYPQPAGCCVTNAGTLPAGATYNPCITTTLSFPDATQTVLDNDDILRYILFSDPADPEASIIATSVTPSFTFNPATMQTGVIYYVAAMAGNGVAGNIDLSDPCLDFSNVLPVIWRPLPTVSFALAPGNSPDLCAGQCQAVVATFSGAAPFNLTYALPSGPVSQTFSSNSATIQVCAPAGASTGAIPLQATVLSDAWCTCQ